MGYPARRRISIFASAGSTRREVGSRSYIPNSLFTLLVFCLFNHARSTFHIPSSQDSSTSLSMRWFLLAVLSAASVASPIPQSIDFSLVLSASSEPTGVRVIEPAAQSTYHMATAVAQTTSTISPATTQESAYFTGEWDERPLVDTPRGYSGKSHHYSPVFTQLEY